MPFKNLRWPRSPSANPDRPCNDGGSRLSSTPWPQEKQQFLGAFQREGGNDDIAAARQSGLHRVIKLGQRLVERPVQPVAIGGFHHHGIGGCGRLWRQQQMMAGAADIARKQNAVRAGFVLAFDQDAGRAQNVAGIVEGRPNARANIDRLSIGWRRARTWRCSPWRQSRYRAAAGGGGRGLPPCGPCGRASSSCRLAASSITSRASSAVAWVAMISPRKPRFTSSGSLPQ